MKDITRYDVEPDRSAAARGLLPVRVVHARGPFVLFEDHVVRLLDAERAHRDAIADEVNRRRAVEESRDRLLAANTKLTLENRALKERANDRYAQRADGSVFDLANIAMRHGGYYECMSCHARMDDYRGHVCAKG